MSHETIHDIERSLENERAALAQTLVALRNRLRPASLVEDGKQVLLQKTSPLLSGLDTAVRGQPVMAAMAGVAVAALVFGRRAMSGADPAPSVPAMAGTKFEALARWEDEGGPPTAEPVDPDEGWLHTAQGVRERASSLLRQIDDAARRGLAPAAQLAKHRAEVVAALAVETKTALGHGLESLTEAARTEAITARERIYLARIAVAEKGRQVVDANPLLTGAVLAAAGAALACLFPQTEAEDKLLGETRDQLSADVKATLQREAVNVSALGRTLSAAFKTDMKRASQLFETQADMPMRHH